MNSTRVKQNSKANHAQKVKQLIKLSGSPSRIRTYNLAVNSPRITHELLNKFTVSQLAELSNLSKSYISQVKHGKRPPSAKLLNVLGESRTLNYEATLALFLKSRREGISPETIRDYRGTLGRSLPHLGLRPSTRAINAYYASLNCTLGGKFGYHKCLRAFYNWLYSPRSALGCRPEDNPIMWVDAPQRPKLILPSLSKDQVMLLLKAAPIARDKAIVALLTESGLRKTELTNIKPSDINWGNRTIRVIGKGRKEAYAAFGQLSAKYLKVWLAQYTPNGGNIWGLNHWGVATMLRRLEAATGLPCNAHTFRRTFACLLRKAGVDSLTIKDLGRWESLDMVQRYTRSVTFEDSLKLYRSPLSPASYSNMLELSTEV